MGPEHLFGADEAIGRKILHPRGLACPPNTHVSASMGPPKGKRNSILEVVSGLGALDRVRARLDKNSDPPRPERVETSALQSKGQASTGELEPMTVLLTSWGFKL